MNTITFDELRAEPDQIIEKLCQGKEPWLITREDKQNLVILPQRDYDSIMQHIDRTELTVKEIENRYADQWILMKVTALDEYSNPDRGIVVTHSDDREALTKPVMQMHRQDPLAQSYIFFTGDVVPENMVVML